MFESAIHPALDQHSRLPRLAARQQSSLAWPTLIGAGVLAAIATGFLELRLRLPGHAIIRSMLPMALGLAFAPRKFGGVVMGLSAFATAAISMALGVGSWGAGALTSLLLLGPCLDLALIGASRGRRLYLAFMLAGLATNSIAYLTRAGAKAGGAERLGARPLDSWWSHALLTYILCGVLAGLISAIICFRASSRTQVSSNQRPSS